MASYGLGARTIVNSAAAAACEVRATSANKPRIMEFSFMQTAAPSAAATYGLGRPAAIGVAPSTDAAEQDEVDASGINALARIAVAWGTAPTAPANFFRRWSVPATAGAGVIWSFPKGLSIGLSSSVVLWLIATPTPSLLDVSCVVDE